MREQGRITDWRDEQGFGFVRPHDGGEKAFVHISAFSPRTHRPAVGNLITYEVARDPKGRRQARNVRFVATSTRMSKRREKRSFELYLFIGILLFLPLMVILGHLSKWVLAGYAVVSVLTFIAYALDKSAARNRRWRIQESTLHLFALIGGWPGALLAQEWLRHKSRKKEFRVVFWVTVVINLLLLGWLLTPSGARFLGGLIGQGY